ncbi:type II toxin-antitoxin system Phd/YefM family antitoxin [Paratractidigestivibacter sp.]|uniref:type II toxin-antitoxin system Phd/YefM family antitoxin n=1 Tax=Paratractidigestivibacter sp. TaxID=2847316 RepID=UPI002AC91894|nr:type II toxin-antitoxin system Phd/YefM family antitoxin [Paratractidigestivibacter sp.]
MTIVPIKELKNTAAISEKCHELDEPIFVTKNGYGDMAIMSMETFQRYDEIVRKVEADKAAREAWMDETVRQLREAHAQVQRDEVKDGFEFMEEMEVRYGL